jgi:hypothetical protein
MVADLIWVAAEGQSEISHAKTQRGIACGNATKQSWAGVNLTRDLKGDCLRRNATSWRLGVRISYFMLRPMPDAEGFPTDRDAGSFVTDRISSPAKVKNGSSQRKLAEGQPTPNEHDILQHLTELHC